MGLPYGQKISQFSAVSGKFWKKIVFWCPPKGWHPLIWKSWIHSCALSTKSHMMHQLENIYYCYQTSGHIRFPCLCLTDNHFKVESWKQLQTIFAIHPNSTNLLDELQIRFLCKAAKEDTWKILFKWLWFYHRNFMFWL